MGSGEWLEEQEIIRKAMTTQNQNCLKECMFPLRRGTVSLNNTAHVLT